MHAKARGVIQAIQQSLIWYESLIIENNLFLQVFSEIEQKLKWNGTLVVDYDTIIVPSAARGRHASCWCCSFYWINY